jgi:APA family basic amino acid/polyamine antiporter
MPTLAWIIGWDLVLEYAVGAATVANGWSSYFQSVLSNPIIFNYTLPKALSGPPINYDPALGEIITTGSIINLPAVIIVAIITFVLVVGIKESAGFNAAMVIVKVACVLFVIIVGAFYVNPANWTATNPAHPENSGFAPYGYTGLAGNRWGYWQARPSYFSLTSDSTLFRRTPKRQRTLSATCLSPSSYHW